MSAFDCCFANQIDLLGPFYWLSQRQHFPRSHRSIQIGWRSEWERDMDRRERKAIISFMAFPQHTTFWFFFVFIRGKLLEKLTATCSQIHFFTPHFCNGARCTKVFLISFILCRMLPETFVYLCVWESESLFRCVFSLWPRRVFFCLQFNFRFNSFHKHTDCAC